MKYVGYHRTSTREQHLDRGIKEINDYCKKNDINIKKIYTDQVTGKNFNRPRYIVMKEDVLEPGDVLIITEVDRLGRNKNEILKELMYYKENGIRVMILEIPTTLVNLSDKSDSLSKMIVETINNMLIEIYAVFAQAEIEKKEKRQKEGIAAMKARGEWEKYGRPRAISIDDFSKQYERVRTGEIRPFQLMKELGLTSTTYYRYKKLVEESDNGIQKS